MQTPSRLSSRPSSAGPPSCQNCKESFNITDRIPKQLKCNHTFCLYCIKYKLSDEIGITCIFDIAIDDTPLNLLPNNENILQSLGSYKIQESDLFIGSLAGNTSQKEIKDHFMKFGVNLIEVKQIQITQASKQGWCFATVKKDDLKAAEKLDGSDLNGNSIKVNSQKIKRIQIDKLPLIVTKQELEERLNQFGVCKDIIFKQDFQSSKYQAAIIISETRQDEIQIMRNAKNWQSIAPGIEINYYNPTKKQQQSDSQEVNKAIQELEHLFKQQDDIQDVIASEQESLNQINEQIKIKRNQIAFKLQENAENFKKIQQILKQSQGTQIQIRQDLYQERQSADGLIEQYEEGQRQIIQCYQCGKQGHMIKDCRYNNHNNNRNKFFRRSGR